MSLTTVRISYEFDSEQKNSQLNHLVVVRNSLDRDRFNNTSSPQYLAFNPWLKKIRSWLKTRVPYMGQVCQCQTSHNVRACCQIARSPAESAAFTTL